jgi:hypothetical protein
MKNKFLLLVAAIVMSVSTAFASNMSAISPIANKAKETSVSTDMYNQVVAYMNSQDIAIVSGYPLPESENYHVTDTFGLNYVVYIQCGLIKGMQEVDY